MSVYIYLDFLVINMYLSAVDQFYTGNDDLLLGICVYNFCDQSFEAIINPSNPQLFWQAA